jgi:hypothetical protein
MRRGRTAEPWIWYKSLSLLPTTLQASESDGGNGRIEFRRIIVWPGGREEVEGITPKQIAPPASHTLPSDEPIALDHKEIKDLEG